MKRGRFIVIEGLEGAGKTTAIETIKRYLNQHVQHLLVTREPGGTRLGENLRQLIKAQDNSEKIDDRSELFMMYAARVQLLERIIKPALERGDWVLSDRFEPSTYAYQGGGRQIDTTIIDNLSQACLNGFKPDLILFLDIPPEQGLQRVHQRGETDRIEKEPIEFFNRVYDAYHQCLRKCDNVCMINAAAPLAEVQQAILANLQEFTERYVESQ